MDNCAPDFLFAVCSAGALQACAPRRNDLSIVLLQPHIPENPKAGSMSFRRPKEFRLLAGAQGPKKPTRKVCEL